MTAHRYLTDRRLEAAARLLLDTDLEARAIAVVWWATAAWRAWPEPSASATACGPADGGPEGFPGRQVLRFRGAEQATPPEGERACSARRVTAVPERMPGARRH